MSNRRKIYSEDQLLKCKTPSAVQEMLGNTYTWLKVIRFAGRILLEDGKYGAAYIVCKCKCGKEIIAQYYHIKRGNWLSCGCRKNGEHSARYSHGRAGKNDKLYYSWKSMKSRCKYSKSNESNKRYIELGIKVCDGWNGKDGFIHFEKDMGEPPSIKHSLDRIDFNGNYSCGHCEECLKNNWFFNCRWADIYTQARNKSSNKYVFIDGVKLTYAEAERQLGFSHGTIKSRLLMGWDLDKIISTPILYSQRTRMNLAKKIVDWSFNSDNPDDVKLFLQLWDKLKPIPIFQQSKKQKLYNKYLNT